MNVQQIKKRLWLIEVWLDYRELFKELFAHVCLFVLFIGVLWLLHLGIEKVDYPQARKEMIEKIDYYGFIIVLIIFAASFIIKVLGFEFRKIRG